MRVYTLQGGPKKSVPTHVLSYTEFPFIFNEKSFYIMAACGIDEDINAKLAQEMDI